MISYLEGKTIFKAEKYIIIDVGGVGYKVFISKDNAAILADNETVKIFTYLYMRESKALELYGFISSKELAFFELLLEVPGVGPKSALAILGEASVDDLERAIASGDEKYLTRVGGIGKKKALKILLELKEKYEGLALVMGESSSSAADVLDALKKLGYSDREAREALRQIPGDVENIEEKVKVALKILGTKR
ncbi:MAG: Holliday junction ATP-dependent DNA helicase RuvA [Parcubacteria group bacterium GW2011_GWA2_40_8]|uniref:Holliday junction branch migration complex subunit RuvA n=1 Tax=Candidatus Terrybacteria bacterium RIFCSPLOWO2_01_FULL_40_23 TaxID=1802366 RepID=A0A1G2PSP7_9BACT|nr:MAG: Holliday junction ATP-dependent DNA helicase RuvA [Parcubacteria group bacterium GW2011_GWB1_40_14]KKR77624.1 MAG: Holliday junction ATP-dependent DNA helicase RuvA [Parcubacteria group bacterium GW2011_GWA2_40_8]OHA50631.1 MAG: Holliday junction DNA helicase RuvA [Candidatus Terrybacteria bacterium RIFCSPLOWO2_01_FULL_40_23]